MPRIGWYANVSAVVNFASGSLPSGVVVEPRWFPTPDGATTSGLLYRPSSWTGQLACVMHPRVDCSHHYLIPDLLDAGIAVWGQRSRWVGNDSDLVHERVLLDIATAHAALQSEGYEQQVLVGNSGGASLYCLYAQQALLPAEQRLSNDAAGSLDLSGTMPAPSGVVLLAPHPGQADMLRHCIDPSVVSEADPGSVDPAVDMFDTANGFATPPNASSYASDFVELYRAAQLARMARIDEAANALIREQAQQRAAGRDGDAASRRRAQAARFLVVHRTDADPRFTDPSLDPSDRAYGSLMSRRPDVTNFGAVGFGRLSTPRAWLSTWSFAHTRAALRLTAPGIGVPSLVLAYRADPCVFPSEVEYLREALPDASSSVQWFSGDHYGLLDEGADDGPRRAAGAAIADWIRASSR